MVERKKTDLDVMIENPFWRFLYRLVYATGIFDLAHAVGKRLEETYFYPRQDAKNWKRLKGDLARVLALKKEGAYGGLELHAIGQSHIDAAWLWRWVDTVEKCRFTFTNAVKHFGQYPSFTFSQSQAAFYHWMELYHPGLFSEIKKAVAAGKWELVGGEWVEPDANVPSGESFVRQRLYGQRYFLEKFGRLARVGWLPDTFGYSYTYPQVLVKSGARYFWTTKLTWNRDTEFPLRTFWWRGLDGSQVLTHISYLGLQHLFNPGEHARTNRLLPPGEELVASYSSDYGDLHDALSDDTVREVGLFYGKGDGGHGPQPSEAKFVTQLEEAGILKLSDAGGFFEKLEAYGGRLPVWDDEMYLETHRGTLTTQAWVKRANRRAEVLLEEVEKFATLADLIGKGYPGGGIRDAWRAVLFNQFHDILPGSSIPEVYEDHRREFDTIFRNLHAMVGESLDFLSRVVDTSAVPRGAGLANPHALLVFNPLSWVRTDIVRARIPHQGRWEVFSADGERVPSQALVRKRDGVGVEYVLFVASGVPPLGYKTYYLQHVGPSLGAGELGSLPPLPSLPSLPLAADGGDASITLESDLFRVKLDVETGYLVELDAHLPGPEGGDVTVSLLDGFGNILRAWEDLEDAWNIDPDYLEKELPMAPPSSVRVTENGPVFSSLEVRRNFRRSTFIQEVTVFRHLPRVEFTTKLAWHERHLLLKVEFETPLDAPVVTCEIPYGHIDRPTAPETPQEKARFEFCGHKWVDLAGSGGEWGLTMVNDSKYGFSVRRDPESGAVALQMTLLRSPQYPFDQIPASITRFKPRPIFVDQGNHLARYALVPHAGSWRDAHSWRAGWEFNYPLVPRVHPVAPGILPAELGFVEVDAPNVVVSTLKKPEPRISPPPPGVEQVPENPAGIQVCARLVEVEGRATQARLKFPAPLRLQGAFETDLLELDPAELPVDEPRELVVEMAPHEIKTVVLDLKFEMQ
ncbi:MAG: alpha-mannosidase [Promethearchaeota archaeon]